MVDRRSFLKTSAMAAVSAAIAPELLGARDKKMSNNVIQAGGESKLIVPKGNALQITGTFLDEISHDIPHQNWGEAEWDRDFKHMKDIGIDTVIDIRCGHKKFITYPSPYLLKQGCYMPSVDLIDMFCRLAQKYGMTYYHGLYDCGSRNSADQVEPNKYVIEEVWERYGSKYDSFGGWYISHELGRHVDGAIEAFQTMGKQCKDISKSAKHPKGLPTFISPWINGKKAISVMKSDVTGNQAVTVDKHEAKWNTIFDGIHDYVDACAFQDGHIDYDELDAFLTVNKKLCDKYGIQCWTNTETFDRDMPIKFFPIKFDKLRLKLEAAKRCGYDKAITFEFSHFMSPQSAYLQAGHLYDRYKEYFEIK